MQDKIKKTRSKKDLIISLLFLLAGVAMCFSSDSSVLICGIVFIIIGIAALIAMKTSFKIDGDGLMLYVYHNADNTKGYAQLKEFVDYDWKDNGELYKLDVNQISQLMSV